MTNRNTVRILLLMKTAREIKLANLDKDIVVAVERANRSGKKGDRLRVQALREEWADVKGEG